MNEGRREMGEEERGRSGVRTKMKRSVKMEENVGWQQLSVIAITVEEN